MEGQENEDETQALLDTRSRPGRCSGPRTIVVEPLLILYVAAGLPMMTIKSQFMYQKVAEAIHVDLTNLTSNGSQCDVVNFTDPDYITRQKVQSNTATLNMYISLAHFIPSFVMTLAFGAIGDQIGRKALLILPCIGSLTEAILYMFIIRFDLSVYFFFLEGVQYLFGGMETLFLGAFAYIADTVPQSSRSFRMTVLDVVSLGNGAVASVFVGYWIKAQGFFWPLVFVASGKVLAIVYGVFFIPETLHRPSQRKMTLRSLFTGVSLIFKDNGSGRRSKINLLLVAFTVGSLIQTYSILTLYEMNSPLCWGPVFIGYFACISMLLRCGAMLLAAGLLRKHIPDKWQVLLSRLSGFTECVFLAFASTTLMMFFAPVLGCIGFLAIPMTRTVLSTHVDKTEQASMFSLMAVSFSFTNLVSSVVTNKIYAASLMFMVGLVFLVDAAVHLVSAAFVGIYIYKTRPTTIDFDKTIQ